MIEGSYEKWEYYQKLYADDDFRGRELRRYDELKELHRYEELIEQQKRRARRDKLETAAAVTLTVIDCLLIIVYCVARIVL